MIQYPPLPDGISLDMSKAQYFSVDSYTPLSIRAPVSESSWMPSKSIYSSYLITIAQELQTPNVPILASNLQLTENGCCISRNIMLWRDDFWIAETSSPEAVNGRCKRRGRTSSYRTRAHYWPLTAYEKLMPKQTLQMLHKLRRELVPWILLFRKDWRID